MDRRKHRTKKPYVKPRLRTIELVAGEVLGVGCKFDSGTASGPLASRCGQPSNPCYESGT